MCCVFLQFELHIVPDNEACRQLLMLQLLNQDSSIKVGERANC